MKRKNFLMIHVRWNDNKIVNILYSFAKSNLTSKIFRFDQKQKKVIESPDMVKRYNKSMGGVDTADCPLSLYRINLRSKKYYSRLVFHMLDMIMVNS